MSNIRSNDSSLGSAQFRRLSEQQCQKLYWACLQVLERTGARVYDQEALDLLKKAGASITDGNRVRVPNGLVEKALSTAPKRVTLYNRNEARAATVAGRLDVESAAPGELDRRGWDVLVNATPRGSGGESFLDPGRLTGRLVLDAVYRRGGTPLVRQARRKGLEAIDGMELLAAQGVLQFERMTGEAVPFEPVHAAGMQWLEGRSA